MRIGARVLLEDQFGSSPVDVVQETPHGLGQLTVIGAHLHQCHTALRQRNPAVVNLTRGLCERNKQYMQKSC